PVAEGESGEFGDSPADRRPGALRAERPDAGVVVGDLSCRVAEVEHLVEAHDVRVALGFELISGAVEADDDVLAHHAPPPRTLNQRTVPVRVSRNHRAEQRGRRMTSRIRLRPRWLLSS